MNNSIANVNVDSNKELFEYEMTQVLLQLKGEFSSVSDKDMHFAKESANSQIPLTLPEEIKPISVNTQSVSCPAVPTVEQSDVPQYELEKPSISYKVENPHYKGFLKTAAVKKHTVDLPSLKSSCCVQLKKEEQPEKISIQKKGYLIKTISCFSCPKIDQKIEVNTEVEIPDFPVVRCTNQKDTSIQTTETQLTLPKAFSVQDLEFKGFAPQKPSSSVAIPSIKGTDVIWKKTEHSKKQIPVHLPPLNSFCGLSCEIEEHMPSRRDVYVPSTSMTLSCKMGSVDLASKESIVAETEKTAERAMASFDSLTRNLSSLNYFLFGYTV